MSFFVPNLDSKEKIQFRQDTWNNIVEQQFFLVYQGNFTYEDTEELAVFERRTLFDLLRFTKDEEKKAREEAREEAENGS